MTIWLGAMIFGTGWFAGVISAAFFKVGARADEYDPTEHDTPL